jgi:hypothetical protein
MKTRDFHSRIDRIESKMKTIRTCKNTAREHEKRPRMNHYMHSSDCHRNILQRWNLIYIYIYIIRLLRTHSDATMARQTFFLNLDDDTHLSCTCSLDAKTPTHDQTKPPSRVYPRRNRYNRYIIYVNCLSTNRDFKVEDRRPTYIYIYIYIYIQFITTSIDLKYHLYIDPCAYEMKAIQGNVGNVFLWMVLHSSPSKRLRNISI